MSRSRSPNRRAYPGPAPGRGYPEPTSYPPTDDRQREWHDYERDYRYERKMRGRSRSPADDDRHFKRRRSGSPHDRDRYEPRGRYDEYGGPSRKDSYSGHSRHRSANPWSHDHPVSFRAFAEWIRLNEPKLHAEDEAAAKDGEKDADGKPVGIKARYEKYKKTLQSQQLETLFKYHKASPWFAERYDPSETFKNLRSRVRKEGWDGKVTQFLVELDEGKHDPPLVEPEATPPQANGVPVESSTSPTSAAVGGDAEMNPTDEGPKPDEEMDAEEEIIEPVEPIENDANATAAEMNGKTTDASGPQALTGDEVNVMPEPNSVMIRTIPPDIGRVKLEEALNKIPHFWYLALGDPMQKKNYYRAGWVRFKDEADIEDCVKRLGDNKIENFKLHVTHSTRPFTTRVRYAPEICSRPERIEKDLALVKKLVAVLEDRAAELAVFKPPKPQTTEGTEEAEEAVAEAPTDGEPEPKDRGSEAVERRLEKLLGDIQEKSDGELSENALAAHKSRLALDLYIAYLRAAFHCCYYCAAITDHAEELQRKCAKHVRKPAGAGDTSKDDNWLVVFDRRIAALTHPESVDPRDYCGKNYDEELSKAVEPHVQQEDEGKFRCKSCNKLFKATSFVEKHLLNKHSTLLTGLEEIEFFNNFALDPHRIQPFQRPPPQIGNGPAIPLQAYGLRSHPTPDYPAPARADYGAPPNHSYSGGYDGGRYGGYYDRPYEPSGYYYPYPPPPYYERRRSPPPRRLSERMDFVYPDHTPMRAGLGPGSDTLPPKPPMAVPMAEGSDRPVRRNRTRGDEAPLPPPPGARDDPRAAAGRRVSYHDMDQVAQGDADVVLEY